MNILFYNIFKVSSTKGGTERASVTVATGLKNFTHCKCFSMYVIPAATPMEQCFEEEFFMPRFSDKQIIDIVHKCSIDVILIQGAFAVVKPFKDLTVRHGLKYKVIFAHHFSPGWELNYNTKASMIAGLSIRHPKSLLRVIPRILYYKRFRRNYVSQLKAYYRKAYEYADRVVLLSKAYVAPYMRFANITDSSKLSSIPNAVSFDEWISDKDYSCKENIVLVVSRLDENQKRLSEVLKIWKMIQSEGNFSGWKLNIVGDGADRDAYVKCIQENRLQNIHLLGRRPSLEEYRKSKIFLMTSRSEGYPLTLIEAKQMGVAPIVYDSFSSVGEIINDGYDGFVVSNGDINSFKQRLALLMSDESQLKQIAENGIKTSHNNSSEAITKQWFSLFRSL